MDLLGFGACGSEWVGGAGREVAVEAGAGDAGLDDDLGDGVPGLA
jgi:hypothetical protein